MPCRIDCKVNNYKIGCYISLNINWPLHAHKTNGCTIIFNYETHAYFFSWIRIPSPTGIIIPAKDPRILV